MSSTYYTKFGIGQGQCWGKITSNLLKGMSECRQGEQPIKVLYARHMNTHVQHGAQHQLEKVQRRAVRFVTRNYHDRHTAKGDLTKVKACFDEEASRLEILDPKGLRPIHHATLHDHLPVVEFILANGGDINIQTNKGDTALHIATQKENLDILVYLVKLGAKTAISNEDKCAPVHLAVSEGKIIALEKLLEIDRDSANLPTDTGATPLHICALKDKDECAQKLFQYGARPSIRDNNGFFPIHIAATSASAKTLDVLIRHLETLGNTRDEIFSLTDKYNNSPLHSAVCGGNVEAVRVCLNAGAACDAQQEDKSTPLHFACAQGSLDMVKLMKLIQPDNFLQAACSNDILKMTPLHRAAMFNHTDVMDFLLNEGVDIDCQDSQQRTPLLLAAEKGGWRSVHLLLERGADIYLKDGSNRNFLHLASKFGCRLNNFGVEFSKFKGLLNEKDDLGCTALHYASREGHVSAIDDLVKLGAKVNPKDNSKRSPLHFAASHGGLNTSKRLLDTSVGANIINDIDENGLSALHLAALNGHIKIINLLMERGANITRDFNDNSPLHMAVVHGYTKSMRLLLSVHPNLMNAKNKNGDTALHIAGHVGQLAAVEILMTMGAKFEFNNEEKTFLDIIIECKYKEIAFAVVRHERWHEVLLSCSPAYGSPMTRFIEHIPEACMAVLDRCQTFNGDPRKPDFYIEYNFEYLQLPDWFIKKKKKEGEGIKPIYTLNKMVKHGRVDCISHPVCKEYLNMKWNAYGAWLHSFNCLQYAIYLVLLTVLVTTTSKQVNNLPVVTGYSNSTHLTTTASVSRIPVVTETGSGTGYTVTLWFMMVLSTVNVLKELVQLVQQKFKYFTSVDNILEMILYITTWMFVTPLLTGSTIQHFQREAGGIAIFLAWLNFFLFLKRFEFFGIYVVMFLEILGTLVKAICVFSILFIAFGLAFYILLRDEVTNKSHSTPMKSIVRVVTMLLELEYISTFSEPYTDNDPTTLVYGDLSFVFLLVYIILMPILLANLLIGLAVGDIEAVQKDAKLKSLANQVELHTDLEGKLPKRFLEFVDKKKSRVYPNSRIYKLKQIWSKMSEDELSMGQEENKEFLVLEQELSKQKLRLKEILYKIERQSDIMKLIVNKMEIGLDEQTKDERQHDQKRKDNTESITKWNVLVKKGMELKKSANLFSGPQNI